MAAASRPGPAGDARPRTGLRAPPRSRPGGASWRAPGGPASTRSTTSTRRPTTPTRTRGWRSPGAPRPRRSRATRRATSPGSCGTASTSASCAACSRALVELTEADDAHTVETPEEAALRAEAARAVQLALSSLPERERRALVLRALGLPHRDVAASLGVSPLRARKLADAGRREFGVRVAAGEQGEPCASTASCLRAIAAGWHISAHRRARLDAHLYACPACRGTLAALRREGALATGPLVIAAPGWWQQVLASVHARTRGERSPDAR